MTIAHLLRAAAIGLPLAAAVAHAAVNQDTGALPGYTAPATPGNGPVTDSCRMRIVSYFSDENLRDIDAALSGIHGWYKNNNLPAPAFAAYDAGRIQYLAKDPGNVITAVEIYAEHTRSMRGMAPTAMHDFDAKHGAKLKWLEYVSIDAMQGIAQQVATNCRAPSVIGPA